MRILQCGKIALFYVYLGIFRYILYSTFYYYYCYVLCRTLVILFTALTSSGGSLIVHIFQTICKYAAPFPCESASAIREA